MITSVIQAGFGNQLFQYAIAYSIAKQLSTELILDISFFDFFKKTNPNNLREYNLDNLSIEFNTIINSPDRYWKYKLASKCNHNIVKKILGLNNLIVEDIDMCRDFQQSVISSVNQESILYGFWQNTQYFKDYISDLRRMFRPSYAVNEEVERTIEEIKKNLSVGVHIRRGDFLNLGWSKGEDYYVNAIKLILSKLPAPRFYIVSDDPEWCRKTFNSMPDIVVLELSSKHKDIDEFFILSNCKHLIISESTFGWWAAYLNNEDNKLIVIPSDAVGEIFTSLPNTIKL